MLTLLFVLLAASVVCFVAAAGNVWPKVNLLALGLALFALVSLLQVGQRLF